MEADRQRRHRVIQAVRRFVQLSTVALVVCLIFLGLYYHYRAARSIGEITDVAGWRGQALTIIDERVGKLDDPEAFLLANNGNLWSMRLGGVDVADPLAFVEATSATHDLHWPLLISILIPVALTVLLGRVFCSWICPGYLVFEATGKLRGVLRRIGLDPPALEVSHANKYVLLIVGVVLAVATSLPIFSMFYPPALLSRTAHAIIFGTGVTGMLTILAVMVVVEVFVSPRWWCRTMCPGGALYGILGSARVLRVRVSHQGCTNCGLCHPACEEGLNVLKESSSIECDNCGACIKSCPEAALHFTLSVPGMQKS